MRSGEESGKSLLFIAHRGFAVQYLENTLTAFEQVIN